LAGLAVVGALASAWAAPAAVPAAPSPEVAELARIEVASLPPPPFFVGLAHMVVPPGAATTTAGTAGPRLIVVESGTLTVDTGGGPVDLGAGRALVRNPQAFLMDEPLSNLDAKLRVQMRAELKRFHLELGATVLYVTHDQLEAVTMADRIAVMNLGVLQQYGTPDEIYHQPVNTFVAGFVGSPAMNLLQGSYAAFDGAGVVRGADGWEIPLSPANAGKAAASSGEVVAGIRHGQVALHRQEHPGAVPARVYTVEPTGDLTYVHFRLGDQLLVASTEPGFRATLDDPIWVEFDQEHLHLFDAASGERLAEPEGAGAGRTRPAPATATA